MHQSFVSQYYSLHGSEKPLRMMVVTNTCNPSTSHRHNHSPEHTSAKSVNHIAFALSTSSDESESTFMDSGIYCQVFNSSTPDTLVYLHLKYHTHFVKASNINYKETIGRIGNHQRQMQYSASFNLQPSATKPGRQRDFSNHNDKSRKTWYPPRHED